MAASCFAQDGARRLFTAPYSAQRTGMGLTVEAGMAEEGRSPPERLPQVMSGVARRSEIDLGEPRTIEIAGDPARFEALMNEFDPSLMEGVLT